MLRINVNISAQGAKSYYTRSSDYYSEGQELVGYWGGKAAERLGLKGAVDKHDWDSLCDNLNPDTGKRITPRTKQVRRVGFDFNFNAPKGVSLLYGLTKDERILQAFEQSVDETMGDLECDAATRVRKSGKDESRATGNLTWGRFVHLTARPVEGEPDPALHAHAFAFNLTFDSVEDRWKAADISSIKRDAPYFEAMFHSRLAYRLAQMGLPVERTRTGWDISGFRRDTLEKFSRRTALIEKMAAERGITDAVEKAELGARTRERKDKALSFPELQGRWRERLTAEESGAVADIAATMGRPAPTISPNVGRDACEQAIDHCFERESVVPERVLLAQAMKASYGRAEPKTVIRAMDEQRLLRGERQGRMVVTTRDVLDEERRMIAFARDGRGTCRPLGQPDYRIERDWLNADQRSAVKHIVGSNDRVILVRGIAGTGKTTMSQEAVAGIEAGGHRVLLFAPSANASRGVLRSKGFKDADTVRRLLIDKEIQNSARGQVLWIDEAGLLGGRDMAEVFNLAERLDCRVILSGDRRQHRSVSRGSALRLLETEAGLVPAELKDIRRQSGRYRDAVRDLSEGHVDRAFRELDALGWIRELPPADRYRQLASDYVETVRKGETALVVSPTHREGDRITADIRAELQRGGELSKDERAVTTLTNLHLTPAERKDAVNYEDGDVLIFHQNAKGFRRGERLTVGTRPMPLDQAARFSVFRPGTLSVAPGEVIRITHGGKAADGQHRLDNGTICTVKNINADGSLTLANGWKLAPGFGHVAYGYVSTSPGAQGSSVDRVFIGQSAESGKAASREQFYVSVSRGEKQAVIYTDYKFGLLCEVSKSADQLTATELDADRRHYRRLGNLRDQEALRGTSLARDPARELAHERA